MADHLTPFDQLSPVWVGKLADDLGLTAEQAAGVIGNLGYESAGFTNLQEIDPLVKESRGGFGAAQWTGPRRRSFEALCTARGLAPASDEANYSFLIAELRGSYRSFTAKLKQCATIEDACRLTHRLYETPSDVLDGSYRSGPDRLKWAHRAFVGAMSMPVGSQKAAAEDGTVRRPEPLADAIDTDLLADLIRAVQRVVGAEPDGIFGRKTAAAIRAAQR